MSAPSTAEDPKPKSSDHVKTYAPQIAGKTILVTGVSPGGLGSRFVERLATSPTPPKLIILAGRTLSKVEQTQQKLAEINSQVETKTLSLDLGDFASVRKAAEEVNAWGLEGIDVLVNNAGIMAVEYSKTKDGLENQLQSNHLGHFLFTNLILDLITRKEEEGLSTSLVDERLGIGYLLGPVRYFDYNFHDGESYNPWTAYGQSKSLQLLFSQELARRYGSSKGLESYAIHPCVSFTNLGSHLEGYDGLVKADQYMGNPQGWGFNFYDDDESVASHIYAAFAPDLKEHNGAYIELSKPLAMEDVGAWARGEIETKKAWKFSEKLVGQEF